MNYFSYKNDELFAEDVPVRELVERFGTPLYVYSAATFTRHFTVFDEAFSSIEHLSCYSVKTNSNTNILRHLAKLGAGVDIVSGGELFRALRAGIDPSRIVYSGVGKSAEEIQAALEADILMFNVESAQELERINDIASKMGVVARVALRINPDVDAKTHPYISTGMQENKFGLAMDDALTVYAHSKELPAVEAIGMDCHIGSQLTSLEPFIEALERLLVFLEKVKALGIDVRYLDLGGGLGIPYDEETPPHPQEFGKVICERLQGAGLKLILEPGRVIAGNAGILVTKVLYCKETAQKNFVIVDAGMNDLIRPSLYHSFHKIDEVKRSGREKLKVDIVGPICESSDFLAKDRLLTKVEQNELLAVHSAGAYGFSMSSQYNSRPRAAEVLVEGNVARCIRRKENYRDLILLEDEGLL